MSIHEDMLYKSNPSRLDYFKRGIQTDTYIREIQQGKKRSSSNSSGVHATSNTNSNDIIAEEELIEAHANATSELKRQKVL